MMGNNGKSRVALHFYSAYERAVKKTAFLPNFNRVTGPSSSKFSLFPSCTSALPRTSRLLASCLCFAVHFPSTLHTILLLLLSSNLSAILF